MSKAKVNKEGVADAVHRAVCEFTDTDGYRQCLFYSYAGMAALTNLSNDPNRYRPQAGTLLVQPDPNIDQWIGNDPTEWASEKMAHQAGDVHCWVGSGQRNQPGVFLASEIVDFTSRHWPRMFADAKSDNGQTVKWNHPDDIPPFVWTHGSKLPDYFRVTPTVEVTHAVFDFIAEEKELFELARLAIGYLPKQNSSRPVVRSIQKDRRRRRKATRQQVKRNRSRR